MPTHLGVSLSPISLPRPGKHVASPPVAGFAKLGVTDMDFPGGITRSSGPSSPPSALRSSARSRILPRLGWVLRLVGKLLPSLRDSGSHFLKTYPGTYVRGYCMPPLTGLGCDDFGARLRHQRRSEGNPGAKARVSFGASRGAEAPLFHGITIAGGAGRWTGLRFFAGMRAVGVESDATLGG